MIFQKSRLQNRSDDERHHELELRYEVLERVECQSDCLKSLPVLYFSCYTGWLSVAEQIWRNVFLEVAPNPVY